MILSVFGTFQAEFHIVEFMRKYLDRKHKKNNLYALGNSMEKTKVFFAYSSTGHTLAEPVRLAASDLDKSQEVQAHIWEHCSVGGKLIIHEICGHIDSSKLFVADLTGMNANVMFELGFAIARNKRIWLLLDNSYEESKKQFDQLKVLTTVGYISATNSKTIVDKFYEENPIADLHNTIFKQAIEPHLSGSFKKNILYLKSISDNEASQQISTYFQKSSFTLTVDDPKESSVQNLSWYGTQVYNSKAVLCHMVNPERAGARLHAARCALVAGMAYGFDIPLLIVAEGNFLAPVDYRDLLKNYSTAKEAVAKVNDFLEPISNSLQKEESRVEAYKTAVKLATDLKSLRLGEYIAENEQTDLVDKYFISTAAYEDAYNGSNHLFVGRKGSGKTANLFKLADALSQDKRNLVCLVKPVSYEMQGFISVLDKYRHQDTKGYAVESIWKYILLTELACACAERIAERPLGNTSTTEDRFLHFVEKNSGVISDDLSLRLQHCIDKLFKSTTRSEIPSREVERVAISETLHMGILKDLRVHLSEILDDYERVTLLVDNLDKAWERKSDINTLSEILLGLLTAAGRLPLEFKKEGNRKDRINLSLAVFLRSDIFHRIRQIAPEPDKIKYSRLDWPDDEQLFRVIEERFVSSKEGRAEPSELWSNYFCSDVKSKTPKKYIGDVILKRPRDLIYFVNACLAVAINRGHARIEVEDILEAEKQYSQYALESISVERSNGDIDYETVLFEFAGRTPPILTESELIEHLIKSGVPDDAVEKVINELCSLTFLGLEVSENEFKYSDEPQELRKNSARAQLKAKKSNGEVHYEIHPAFRAFLEVGN